MRMAWVLSFASSLFLFAPQLHSQQTATTIQRDPQALTLAKLSVQALTSSQSLTDATLQGTANFTTGSAEESGSFLLELKGNQESKLVLNLTGGIRQEIRQLQAGAWVGPDGQKHASALHNSWTDASTLLPVFSLAAALSNSQIATIYLGQTTINGVTADHLQLSKVASGQDPRMATQIQQLSTMDIYLNPASHLPLVIAFNTHPDDNLRRGFPVEIQFSSYQQFGGIQVPTRIQKFLQGTLTLDLAVKSIATNTGIADSEFSTQ